MIFEVNTTDKPTYLVRARSWFEARHFAQSEHGRDLLSVTAANVSDDAKAVEAPAFKSATELAHEHGESLRAAGYRDAMLEAIEIVSQSNKPLAELRRRAGL